tara:strand:+ start:278 stop:634 length:357 start_codon:yes stop_codon:yes gene_type:complete
MGIVNPVTQRRKGKKMQVNTNNAKFDGSNYKPEHDKRRLTGQILRIFDTIKDGCWRTLEEIQKHNFLNSHRNDPQASISAQLRNLRKERFGGFTIEKRYRGDRSFGLWEYRLVKEDDE